MKRTEGGKQGGKHGAEKKSQLKAAVNLGCNTAVCHISYHSLEYQGCVLFIMSFSEAELRRQLSGISVKWRQLL